MLILGLGNRARHGKDSFAAAVTTYFANLNAAAARHGLKHKPVVIQHIAFADALYREVNDWLFRNPAWAKASPEGRWFVPDEKNIAPDGTNIFYLPEWVQPEPSAEISVR